MLSTRKTITIVALALAGVLSVGAVASAQAQNGPGSAPRTDDRTPATSVPSPSSDDNGLRGDGTVDDNGVDDNGVDDNSGVVPTTTPAPSTGLPTDADHPQGDDSIGRVDGDDDSDDGPGHDAGDDSQVGAGAHHESGHDDGHDNSGHSGSDDSGSDH